MSKIDGPWMVEHAVPSVRLRTVVENVSQCCVVLMNTSEMYDSTLAFTTKELFDYKNYLFFLVRIFFDND
jgi:hypothetical protein